MSQTIAFLGWWALAALIGLLAWPLVFRLLRFVPDRGYTAARPMGLLLSTYTWWLLGSLGFLSTSLGSVMMALTITGSLAAWFYYAQRSDDPATLTSWLRRNLSYILTYELLFFIACAGWAYFRAHSPAINHTEKPMEFRFLNGILRSSRFPPNDPWLSGYGTSYYYMGYVMMALLTRVSGTTPGVAYNTAHAVWFALSAGGAFGAAYNLVRKAGQGDKETRRQKSKALLYGLLAAVLLMMMGNLGGILELAHQNNVGSPGFWKWLDVADLSGPAASGGGLVPQRGSWWWWRASRVINDYRLNGNSQHNDTTVIDEFPQFSFILGDMHPHVLGLPFALLSIMLAFNLYRSDLTLQVSETSSLTSNLQTLASNSKLSTYLFYALTLGAMGFLNASDYPTYLALAIAAYGLRRWREEGGISKKVILEIILMGVGLGIAGLALYLPFYLSFQSQVHGISPNLFYGTRISQFLVMFGPFLVIGACFILALVRRARHRLWLDALGWTAIVLIACVILALMIGIISAEGRTYLRAWLQDEPLPGLDWPDANSVVVSRLLGRLLGTSTPTPRSDGVTIQVPGSGPWVPSVLALTIVTIVLVWRESFSRPSAPPASQSIGHPSPFILLLLATGATAALGVEFVFLSDAFGSRMNTIFKFYFQVWVLWSVASAYGAYYVIDNADNGQGVIARTAQATLMAVLILAGLVYPIMGIPSRTDRVPLTLDGTAYLARENPDEYAAIQWLNANAEGAAVILEAPGDSFQAWTSRVSGYTGLPTLLGWRGHESQWRKDFAPIMLERESDIQEIYNTRDIERALALLDKYDVSYIYVGHREKAQYSSAGLAKFDGIGTVVFQQGSVMIYRTWGFPE